MVCGTADCLLGQPSFLSGRSGEVLLCVSPEPLLLHTPSLCHVEEDQDLAMKCVYTGSILSCSGSF